ncbi:MAG: enolase-phosphatase E1, partial [Halothiobacillaceae bacterium]
YSRQQLPDYVRRHHSEPQVSEIVSAVKSLMHNSAATVEEVIAQLLSWIDQDQKITPLKALQGLIWEAGYRNGDFTGHLYEDAARNLRRWHEQGIALYVFSSGSVYAQKLLFGFSDFGDLTPLFSGYFDTTSGNKGEAGAYRTILQAINTPAAATLFLSDIRAELDAAATAGMQTTWLVRDHPTSPHEVHRQVQSFDDIVLAQ